MNTNHPFLFGLTNDAFGYFLTSVDYQRFKRYDYVGRTSLGENAGDILFGKALKFIKDNPGPVSVTKLLFSCMY